MEDAVGDATALRPSSSMSGQRPASQASNKSSAASGALWGQIGVIPSLGVARLEEMEQLIKSTAQKLKSMPAYPTEATEMQIFDYKQRTSDLRSLTETCSGLEQILKHQQPIVPRFPQHHLDSMAAECQSMSEEIQRLQSPLDQWFESQDGELQGILQAMTSKSLALVSEANSSQFSFAYGGEEVGGRGRTRSPATVGSKRRATLSTTRNASEDAGPPPLRQEGNLDTSKGHNKIIWNEAIDKRLLDLRTRGKSWQYISAAVGPSLSACRQRFNKSVLPYLTPEQVAAIPKRGSGTSPASSSGLSSPPSSPGPSSPDSRER